MAVRDHQLGARVTDTTYSDLRYEAKKRHETMNQFINDGLHYWLNFVHHDYDLPDFSARRLNQLIDAQHQSQHLIRDVYSELKLINRLISGLLGNNNPYAD